MFRKCPRCGSFNVRRSALRSKDGPAPQMLRSPYRCRDCGERFSVIGRNVYFFVAAVGVAVVAVAIALLASGDGNFRRVAPEPAGSADPDARSMIARAESGEVAAAVQLAQLYAAGDGMAKDAKKAALWLERAARQGDPEAQYEYGMALREGRGAVQDDVRALAWLQQAADAGYAKAQFELGRMYFNGAGTPVDKLKAYTWLNVAAAQAAAGAAALRDVVRGQLSAEEVVKAQAEARRLSEIQSEPRDKEQQRPGPGPSGPATQPEKSDKER